MKRRTFLGVAGSGLTATAATRLLNAETTNASSSEENSLLDLERKWMDAMVQRDESVLTDLMADDFERVERPWPNISMYKKQWIGNSIRFYRVESFKFLDVNAKVGKNKAVISVSYRWRGADEERPFNETVTAEDTWE